MTSSKGLKRNNSHVPPSFSATHSSFARNVGAQSADQVRSVQNIFAPVGPPAELIHQTSVLVLLICLGIFVVVGGLLFYAVVRYRQRPTDDDTTEPPQVYGSTAIELAWTVPPILIVVVLALATARTVGEIQNPKFAGDPLQVQNRWSPFLVGGALPEIQHRDGQRDSRTGQLFERSAPSGADAGLSRCGPWLLGA